MSNEKDLNPALPLDAEVVSEPTPGAATTLALLLGAGGLSLGEAIERILDAQQEQQVQDVYEHLREVAQQYVEIAENDDREVTEVLIGFGENGNELEELIQEALAARAAAADPTTLPVHSDFVLDVLNEKSLGIAVSSPYYSPLEKQLAQALLDSFEKTAKGAGEPGETAAPTSTTYWVKALGRGCGQQDQTVAGPYEYASAAFSTLDEIASENPGVRYVVVEITVA